MEGRKKEYLHEIKAYMILKPLQGTVIPRFYGQTIYDSSPAMILSDVDGINLDPFSGSYYWDRRWKLGTQLEIALKCLWSYGVILERAVLSNFLWVDKERVMIIDLSLVSFHAAASSHWRPYLNVLVSRLLHDFRNDYTESRRQIGAREIFIGKDPSNVVDAMGLINILRKPVRKGFSSRELLNRHLF
ncbi:uncharacterized protein N7459_004832 [Penicillium hispanicum]|uniref:uncharacterized protein n=1 Tax=Penicillium hispanicum TaxID=1080232 RepID=UPI0025405140|nr:uncharacterized protein N7459_004832 [Penicillium hispanicum]KAJ5585032.1 hypothetical protein N7459_004832 [Penicillium hispanicum]